MIQSFAKGGQKYLQLKRGAEASGNEKGNSMKETQYCQHFFAKRLLHTLNKLRFIWPLNVPVNPINSEILSLRLSSANHLCLRKATVIPGST